MRKPARSVGYSRWPPLLLTAAAAVLLVLLNSPAQAAPPAAPSLGSLLTNDFTLLVDNAQLDVQDVVTAPCHAVDQGSVLRSPRFYLAMAGVGALWGGSFALDQTLRSRLHDM